MQDLTKGPFAEDLISNSVNLRKQARRGQGHSEGDRRGLTNPLLI